MLVEERIVAEPLPRLVQRDQIERRGVGGTVVRRVRDQAEVGELAAAHLVGDLAGLGIAEVVELGRLQLGELLERAPGERGMNDHVLQAGDERVAAEERDEPRHTGGREPDVGAEVVVVQTQRAHVPDRLAEDPVDVLVRARQLGRHLEPAVVQLVLRCAAVVVEASRCAYRLASVEQVVAAGVPRRPGGELELERDPAVRVAGRGAAVQELVDEPPAKVAIGVRGLELRAPGMPPRHDAPPADEATKLDLEQIGKVRTEGDLEVEANGHQPMVGDVEVLVDAVRDGAIDDE